jgi:hypothetical protein
LVPCKPEAIAEKAGKYVSIANGANAAKDASTILTTKDELTLLIAIL